MKNLDNSICPIMSRDGNMIPCHQRYCTMFDIENNRCMFREFMEKWLNAMTYSGTVSHPV
jgi:hypothetical protein